MKRLILFSLIVLPVFFLSISKKASEQDKPVVDPYLSLSEAEKILKAGDIVLRMNKDPMSHYIRNFNLVDKRYSHAGIVLSKNGKLYVYDIINGPENPGERIRYEPLTDFCNPGKNTAWGIYRYDLTENELNKMHALMNEWIQKKIVFDKAFDPDTDDALYCSEMISKMFALSTNHRIRINTRKPNKIEALCLAGYAGLPLQHCLKIRMIAIEDLYLHPSCTMIKEFSNHP